MLVKKKGSREKDWEELKGKRKVTERGGKRKEGEVRGGERREGKML